MIIICLWSKSHSSDNIMVYTSFIIVRNGSVFVFSFVIKPNSFQSKNTVGTRCWWYSLAVLLLYNNKLKPYSHSCSHTCGGFQWQTDLIKEFMTVGGTSDCSVELIGCWESLHYPVLLCICHSWMTSPLWLKWVFDIVKKLFFNLEWLTSLAMVKRVILSSDQPAVRDIAGCSLNLI